jgi:hypothetical protein
MSEYFNKETSSDMTLIVNNSRHSFQLHKAILYSRSEFFRKLSGINPHEKVYETEFIQKNYEKVKRTPEYQEIAEEVEKLQCPFSFSSNNKKIYYSLVSNVFYRMILLFKNFVLFEMRFLKEPNSQRTFLQFGVCRSVFFKFQAFEMICVCV